MSIWPEGYGAGPGPYRQFQTDYCQRCGAVVMNIGVHTAWHDRVEPAEATLNPELKVPVPHKTCKNQLTDDHECDDCRVDPADIESLVEKSSLGTEAVKAAIDSVSPERGRRLVEEAARREACWDMESYAAGFNAGFDEAMRQVAGIDDEPTESVGRVKSIDWYRFMTAEFATANFGFPDGHARQFGEMHQAPDNSSWIWLGENWEVAQYAPVDKEGEDS